MPVTKKVPVDQQESAVEAAAKLAANGAKTGT
jgi:hypothetical protein